MTKAQATVQARNRELTGAEKDHFIERHLTIIADKAKNLIQFGYALECGEPGCPLPKPRVGFYVCPSKPCPPSGYSG